MAKILFVESLTLRAWVWSIWPSLLLNRLRNKGTSLCYVFNSSSLMMILAKISTRLLGTDVRRMVYRLVEVRDERGLLVRLRVEHDDIFQVQEYATSEPVFKELLQSGSLQDRLPLFLTKSLGVGSRFESDTLWITVILMQACLWLAKQSGETQAERVMFLSRRPWIDSLRKYAADHGLVVVPVFAPLDVPRLIRRRLPSVVIDRLRVLKARLTQGNLLQTFPVSSSRKTANASSHRVPDGAARSFTLRENSRHKVVIDYYGQLNLNEPHLHSDLSFWQQSSLEGSDLLLSFALPSDPLDEQKLDLLSQHGIDAVALSPGAVSIPGYPVFKASKHNSKTKGHPLNNRWKGLEGSWFKGRIQDYQTRRAYWRDLFESRNAKVYVTFNESDAAICSVADAINDVGGVLAKYEKSYQCLASIHSAVAAEIVFNFSSATAKMEEESGSVIPYHVATGYLGDHRFALLRDRSGVVRESLQRSGARQILAYLDENSADDERLHTGHQFMRENYDFLLRKVLAEPWLGLVMKPKNPGSLRRRLGSVASLLQEAEATGRAYVYEAGVMQGSISPAEAALEADLVVHGHLCGGTAGMESVFAGVPTLLMDREGWPVSPLYNLPMGRVVFRQWEDLWKACLEHWSSPAGVPGFGDWTPMLDELDPFRDGRASERMGNYLHWLIQGFNDGLDRETVLADAAERYCKQWGYDKIKEVNRGLRLGQPISPRPKLDLVWSPNDLNRDFEMVEGKTV